MKISLTEMAAAVTGGQRVPSPRSAYANASGACWDRLWPASGTSAAAGAGFPSWQPGERLAQAGFGLVPQPGQGGPGERGEVPGGSLEGELSGVGHFGPGSATLTDTAPLALAGAGAAAQLATAVGARRLNT